MSAVGRAQDVWFAPSGEPFVTVSNEQRLADGFAAEVERLRSEFAADGVELLAVRRIAAIRRRL